MNHSKALSLSKKLMTEYPELKKWQIRINNRKLRRLGCARLGLDVIELTGWYVKINDEPEVRDTILHELAHALAWVRHRHSGHGYLWKAICLEIGARPERRANTDEINSLEKKWVATCKHCEIKAYRNRQLKQGRYHVCKCTRGMVDRPRLVYQLNPRAGQIRYAAQKVKEQGMKTKKKKRGRKKLKESTTKQDMKLDIRELLNELKKSKDAEDKKRIRRLLRRRGHKGGLGIRAKKRKKKGGK